MKRRPALTPTRRGMWDAITTRAKKALAELTESAHEDGGVDKERAEQLSDEGLALLREADLDGARHAWTEARLLKRLG